MSDPTSETQAVTTDEVEPTERARLPKPILITIIGLGAAVLAALVVIIVLILPHGSTPVALEPRTTATATPSPSASASATPTPTPTAAVVAAPAPPVVEPADPPPADPPAADPAPFAGITSFSATSDTVDSISEQCDFQSQAGIWVDWTSQGMQAGGEVKVDGYPQFSGIPASGRVHVMLDCDEELDLQLVMSTGSQRYSADLVVTRYGSRGWSAIG